MTSPSSAGSEYWQLVLIAWHCQLQAEEQLVAVLPSADQDEAVVSWLDVVPQSVELLPVPVLLDELLAAVLGLYLAEKQRHQTLNTNRVPDTVYINDN